MNQLPTITKNLLIINVLCFFGTIVARRYGIDLESMFGLHFFLASDFNPIQLITYMFMHANFEHIFSICSLYGCSDVLLKLYGDLSVSLSII